MGITKKLLSTFIYKPLHGHKPSLLLGKYLRVERLSHMVGVCLTSKETAKFYLK